ncbi:related to pisatin demethylase cytochrome P450 [Fusarium fujikuroi]|nr:related to pisatin demethylase cytochrome P450 [Fusarium fujikuroi]
MTDISLLYLILGLILASGLLKIATFVYGYFFSPLKSIPGPFLARFTDAWYLWRLYKGNFERDNVALHREYGPVVRYGPRRYSINDPAAIKAIYGLEKAFPKSSWYDAWVAPGEVSLFADRDTKRHAYHRRLFQNNYSMSSLISYEPYVDECADLFVQRLSEISQTGLPLDMGHWLQCYAFDVIGLITYGKRLGFLDSGKDIGGVMEALEAFLSYAAPVGIYSKLHPFLFSVKNYFAGSSGTGRAYVISFTRSRVAESMKTPTAVPAEKKTTSAEPFLLKFLEKHEQSPDKFTSTNVTMGCVANMVAGSDTTGITLSAILYYLLKHPPCLAALQQEIDFYYSEGKLSGKPTFQETQQMPYLQAVIKETLRLHPATGLPLERVVPKGGATISGHFFPEGSIIGINTWVQHRNQSIYGLDADIYRPERWLTTDEEQLSVMNRHWIPFGLGSRTCLGRHISMLEISKLIPKIVREFNYELDGDLAQMGTNWSTFNFWFVKPKGFQVRISPRHSS